MQNVRVFLVLTLAWCVWAQEPHYIETGECKGEQLCSYSYSAQQQYHDDGESHRTQINATVDITCTSSGMYNGSDATLYCMDIKNANLMSHSLVNSSDTEINEIRHSLNSLLENWFCFVQSSNGKVPAVFHSPSEPDHAISLKKAIAAAFQANFEGTEEEEETDPQSRHKSHYTYDPTTEEGVKKMHRRVRGEDISEYSTEEASEDVETTKDEDIEYRFGKLHKSSGNTTFHLVNKSSNINSSFSLSQAFSASGSYSIGLLSCRRMNKYALGLQKKKILSEMRSDSKEEGLKATIDRRSEATHQMKTLRAKLPAGSALRALQNHEAFGDKLFQTLATLIKLESEFGTLPMYIPVIDDVMTFIANIPEVSSDSERRVKEAVLMLLTTEGSLRSQMALLNAFDNAVDREEANTILTQISFLENVRVGFVIAMEERLSRSIEDQFIANQLLLVFGSLATKGSDEVEDRVMNLLTARVTALNAQAHPDVADIILTLRALGNTGSKLSIGLIFGILDSSVDRDDYNEIKVATIDSVVKVTDDPIVLAKLEVLLEEDPTARLASEIIDTLISALEYVKERKLGVPEYISNIKAHTLLYSVAEIVAVSNETDLHLQMDYYLKKIKADDDLFALIYTETGPLGHRSKRGTDWDQNNSNYNLVSSLSSRQSDVNTYPNHLAYINSHSFGVDQGNARISYGFFAGGGTHCDRAKAFGRARLDVTLIGNTYTLADARVEVRATTTSANIDAYATVAGNTYFTYQRQYSISECQLYTRNVAEFRRGVSWSYNIFVYVGYLSLTVRVEAFLTLDVNANMCIGRTGTEVTGALGALTPRVGVTLGGGVSANLLELARGGVDLTASFSYQLEPAASIQGCTAYCTLSARVCIGIYDSFPASYIDLETWYQTRTWDWCGSGWLSYPCLVWGSRHRWDDLSARWNLGSQSRRALYQYCYGNLHPTCAAGALSSPLFSY